MATNREGWTTRLRRSPMYQVIGVLPTPVRPWLLAFETIAALRLAYSEGKHTRREAALERQLQRVTTRRGGALRGLILGVGLTWLARRLLATRPAASQRLRVSGFVNDALDRVQHAADERIGRVRSAVAGKQGPE